MRKSICLLATTPSSHTHRFHPLPLATPASCSPHTLATPIHSTHSPQLSSILLTCAKLMTIVESGWNVWVWSVGVVCRRRVWLVGVGEIYGCGYWVWLQGGIYISSYLSLLLLCLFFFAAASLLFVHLKKSFLYIYVSRWSTCPAFRSGNGAINPRRACARVTVLVLSVCVCVCVFSLFWHLAQSGVQTAVSATSARYGHEI